MLYPIAIPLLFSHVFPSQCLFWTSLDVCYSFAQNHVMAQYFYQSKGKLTYPIWEISISALTSLTAFSLAHSCRVHSPSHSITDAPVIGYGHWLFPLPIMTSSGLILFRLLHLCLSHILVGLTRPHCLKLQPAIPLNLDISNSTYHALNCIFFMAQITF